MLQLRDRKLMGANCPSSAILHITNCPLEIIRQSLDHMIDFCYMVMWLPLHFRMSSRAKQHWKALVFKRVIMPGKGKGKRRRTAWDSGGAKRSSGTKEGNNTVDAVSDQPDHSGNASNSKVKDVVDFEAVLKSTNVQLPPASQRVSAAQNQGTQDVGWLCWGLTSQSTIFQSYRDGAIASWVINQYFRGVKCLAQGHNTAAVGLEPRTSRSGVRHSTTEPPRSPTQDVLANIFHSLQSALGQNVESVHCSSDEILHTFPKRYANKFVKGNI